MITPIVEPLYTIDVSRNQNFYHISAMQGDGYGVRIARIALVSHQTPYTLNPDEVTAVLGGEKPDGFAIMNDAEIVEPNIIQFELTPQICAKTGRSPYCICIFSKNTAQLLSSFPFDIVVSESPLKAQQIVSSDEFGVLTSQITRLDQVVNNTDQSIKKMEDAVTDKINETNTFLQNAQNAERIRVAQENQRQANETTRQANEESRISSEQNREIAESKRQTDTEIAVTNAGVAEDNARIAADYANTVAQDLEDKRDNGFFTGPKGDRGDSGVVVTAGGMFTLAGDAEGNLYADYLDTDTPPQFEYNATTGDIFYLTPNQ